jgi:hypothetical protein
MRFLAENWTAILVWAVIIWAVLVFDIVPLIKAVIFHTNGDNSMKVKAWLLWAVTQAEEKLGEKTGRLKLSMVYDAFVVTFPWLAKIMSFGTFSGLVDTALDELKKLVESNPAVKEIVPWMEPKKE